MPTALQRSSFLCVRLLTCDANLDVRDAVRDLVLPLCHHLCSGLYYNNMLDFLLEDLWDWPAWDWYGIIGRAYVRTLTGIRLKIVFCLVF